MGYTHYWTFVKNLNKNDYTKLYNETQTFLDFCFKKKACTGIIGDGHGEGFTPHISKEGIFYNGRGDNAHETMYLYKSVTKAKGFHFCKTARKPYDRIVFANILLIKYICGDQVDISSDGVCFYNNKFDVETDVIAGIKFFIDYLIYRDQVVINDKEQLLLFVNKIFSWFREYDKIELNSEIIFDEKYLLAE